MVHSKALSGHEAEVDLVLVHLSFSYGDYAWKIRSEHKEDIYIIKQEGLYQSKVNSSL